MWYTYYTGLENAGKQLMRNFEDDLCLTNFCKDLTIYETLWRKLSHLMNGFSTTMEMCYATSLTADLSILFLNLYTIYDFIENALFCQRQEKESISDYESKEIVSFVGITCFIILSVIRLYIITSSAHGAMKQLTNGFSSVMDLCYTSNLAADLSILFLNLYSIYDFAESLLFNIFFNDSLKSDREDWEIVTLVGLTCFIVFSVTRIHLITSSAHSAMKQVRDNTKRKLLNLISEIQISKPGKEQQVKKFLAKVSTTPVSIRLSGFEVNNSLFLTVTI
ncbi:hypothetical protein LSTR_LSTR003356 [Laodelphax striatellus]|uniref:Gustatory receptor n=1 Tax=Laodelphax striatellus TaxID=195883 RepID=A0A482X5G0_LAOST|nr:hypothetical protein LSTR_LSTR003356 [Laodelphax striatellus]